MSKGPLEKVSFPEMRHWFMGKNLKQKLNQNSGCSKLNEEGKKGEAIVAKVENNVEQCSSIRRMLLTMNFFQNVGY